MNAILSIKPEYVQKIFDGTKKFEFRKVNFKHDINTIFIYATFPISKIVGKFDVGDIILNNPKYVWNKTKEYSGISKDFFDLYFSGKQLAVAIEVIKPVQYAKPIDLAKFSPGATPPQSFIYVNN
ncbi:hypothetical protein [Desulfomicrobium norvegicum]|uniref:hypothetical protein n=1 Tax=Desulfomicrobium norvegicum (strain DSM 1741 / NCIMB 8310) TaxID=52561 RepID=UPI000B816EFE|nr:hypothetical protein [Desulfomicrobium norvegicum]